MKNPKKITFIHSADLHLGPPLRSIKSYNSYSMDEWKRRLMYAPFEAFEKAVAEAIKKKVNFFIISGDVFDTEDVGYGDYARFKQSLEKLNQAKIEVYICAGNHDPLSSWKFNLLNVPSNTHFFKAEQPTVFKYSDSENFENRCLLIGTSYKNKTWPMELNPTSGFPDILQNEPGNVFFVGVLHTGLETDLDNAPVKIQELDKLGINYWALGHIHKKETWKEKHSTIAFPGCIQGLHINATGVNDSNTKGAYGVNYVELTQNTEGQIAVKTEFIPTTQVLWKRLKIDVSETKTIPEIEEKINKQVEQTREETKCPYVCIRVTLVGATDIHKDLVNKTTLEGIKNQINYNDKNCLCDEVMDETSTPYNKEDLLEENLFPASTIRASESFLIDADQKKQKIQEMINKTGIETDNESFDKIDFHDIISRAQIQALDYLQGEF